MGRAEEILSDQVLQQTKEVERHCRTLAPYPRPAKSSQLEMSRFVALAQSQTQAQEAATAGAQRQLKLSPLRFDKVVCTKPLASLALIHLRDMLVNKRHEGRYLLCRTLAKPVSVAALILIVEDELGDVEIVSAYNCAPQPYSDEATASALIPANSVLLIKEPTLAVKSNLAEVHILVDSPSDLVLVHDDASHPFDKAKLSVSDTSFDALNRQGNERFVARDYHTAIRYYTLALNAQDNSDSSIVSKALVNRAAAYLALGHLESAFEDARRASELEPGNEKAHYRMARAAYLMRDYTQACDAYAKCLEANGANRQASVELAKAKLRTNEQLTGAYDFKDLLAECESGALRIDAADYTSPHIKHVGDWQTEGSRGVLATRPIKRGTLVVASKAVTVCYEKELPTPVCSYDLHEDKMRQPSHVGNLGRLASAMQHDRRLARQVYELYAGKRFQQQQQQPVEIDETIVDIERVEAILVHNSFDARPTGHAGDNNNNNDADADDAESPPANTGLWIELAHFKHACMPNTKIFFIGDLVFLYAGRDIDADEELTIAKNTDKEKSAEFGCECHLCELDNNEPELSAKRETIVDQVLQVQVNESDACWSRLKKLHQQLEATFDKRQGDLPKFGLHLTLDKMAMCQLAKMNERKAADLFVKAYEVVRELDHDYWYMKSYLLQAVQLYTYAEQTAEAERCFKLAADSFVGHKAIFYYMCTCEDSILVDPADYEHLFTA